MIMGRHKLRMDVVAAGLAASERVFAVIGLSP
jgi:hypothetical protein